MFQVPPTQGKFLCLFLKCGWRGWASAPDGSQLALPEQPRARQPAAARELLRRN